MLGLRNISLPYFPVFCTPRIPVPPSLNSCTFVCSHCTALLSRRHRGSIFSALPELSDHTNIVMSRRHPGGVLVEIVGLNEGGRGRSCEQHAICGSVISLDMVLRLRAVQITNGTLLLLPSVANCFTR